MASIRKVGKRWRAEIARKGVRKSRVFATRREASDWAAHEEFLITGGEKVAATLSFGDVLKRYSREVSPSKRGARWEIMRLEKMQRDPIARKRLSDVTAADLARWRDTRLGEVQPGTVRREMGILSGVFSVAKKEWGLLRSNPMENVKKPPSPQGRERLPTPAEIERLRDAAGDLSTYTGRAFHAFMFSCETAMRAGEVCGLTWDCIDLDRGVAHLHKTKNGRPRDVPLSRAARAMLVELESFPRVFSMTPRQLDANWRKLRAKAKVDGLTFHDSRHHAITQLAQRVEVLDLARIVGHTDLKMLMRYYNRSASDIADMLG
jgi:integrase